MGHHAGLVYSVSIVVTVSTNGFNRCFLPSVSSVVVSKHRFGQRGARSGCCASAFKTASGHLRGVQTNASRCGSALGRTPPVSIGRVRVLGCSGSIYSIGRGSLGFCRSQCAHRARQRQQDSKAEHKVWPDIPRCSTEKRFWRACASALCDFASGPQRGFARNLRPEVLCKRKIWKASGQESFHQQAFHWSLYILT
eukprot:4557924-Amphidinium_carterae.1